MSGGASLEGVAAPAVRDLNASEVGAFLPRASFARRMLGRAFLVTSLRVFAAVRSRLDREHLRTRVLELAARGALPVGRSQRSLPAPPENM